jgi:hypothetical protein
MEINIMKKQIIAAAVAASVSAVAMADISITGDAKYEYLYTDNSDGTTLNEANTEMHINIAGKKGDTGVVIKTEIDTHGDGNQLDIEDNYITTKVGDINVKAGNYASGTTALLGEIDEGGRATNKVTLDTTIGGVKLYAGNQGRTGDATNHAANTGTNIGGNREGFVNLQEDMFAGVVFDVAGNTVEFKKNSSTVDSVGVKGSFGGINYRLEQKQDSPANGDTTFGEIGTTVNGISLSYAWIDSDKAGQITETDSAIFAKEAGNLTGSTDDGTSQVTVKTSIDGNKVTVKAGTIDNAFAANKDQDWTQVIVSRPLASGATATITYTDADTSSTADATTFEAELAVSF